MSKLLWILCLLTATSGMAEEVQLESIGTRAGLSINQRSDSFRQIEATADLRLPWHWQLGDGWWLRPRADLSAGWLSGEGRDAFVATGGPSVVLGWKDFPLTFAGGSSPTYISRERFGDKDFGLAFQFTTHAGLEWNIGSKFRLSYRYQHMSNAGLGSPNPGLNLHMLAISYLF